MTIAPEAADAAPAPGTQGPHHLTSVRSVAATAHPLRHRLLDLIDVYGPASAARLAERTGMPLPVVEEHLGVLQDGGLVEPESGAEALVRWRRVSAQYRTLTQELPGDPISKAVVRAMQAVNRDRHDTLLQTWTVLRESFDEAWRASAFTTDSWLWLSPGELGELREQVCALFDTWARRQLPDDGADRRPVHVLARAVRTEP